MNSAGTGPLSGLAGPVTPVSAPNAPTDVTAVPVDVQTAGFDNGVVTVSWTAPNDNGSPITGYTVRYGAGVGNVWAAPRRRETTCDVTGLPVGVPLSFNVTATNASGDGPASAGVVATARTVSGAPVSPVAIPGNQSAAVSWQVPAFGITGGTPITSYEVTVLDDTRAIRCSSTGCTAAAPALGCTVDGLTNGDDYSFSVVAVNAAGSSLPATTSVVTPLAVPQSPTDLAVELGNGEVTVSWVAPVDTGGTVLTGFTVTADPGGASCTAAAGDTSCVVTGLTKGSTYTFEVVAENSVGGSVPATIGATVPTRARMCRRIVSLTPGRRVDRGEWTAPASDGGAPIASYLVTAYSSSNPAGTTCTAVAPSTSCDLTGLTNDVPHFIVRASHQRCWCRLHVFDRGGHADGAYPSGSTDGFGGDAW